MSRYLYLVRNRVREQRAERGLSQAELAAALGVSRQTVISIEGGRYAPSLPLAFRIARIFAMPVEQLFDPEEEEVSGCAVGHDHGRNRDVDLVDEAGGQVLVDQ
jgi:putative transcriptional regulator